MKTNYLSGLVKGFFFMALLSFTTSFSQNKYQTQMNVIFDVFITKNFQPLASVLKPQDKNYFAEDRNVNLKTVVEQICLVGSPESYRIIEAETIGDDEKITVEYQYQDKARRHYFYFNPKGKLIGLEVAQSSSFCQHH